MFLVHIFSSTNTTQTRRRPSNSKRARRRDTDPTVIMPLKDFTSLLSKHRGSQIALDVYVELLPHQLASANTEQTKHAGTESIFGLANAVRDHITPATDYRWRFASALPVSQYVLSLTDPCFHLVRRNEESSQMAPAPSSRTIALNSRESNRNTSRRRPRPLAGGSA